MLGVLDGARRTLESLLHTTGNGDMPAVVQKALVAQYHLEPNVIGNLKCVSRAGSFAGQRVKSIRVFDPAQMGNVKTQVRKYEDLTNRRGAILFEGSIDEDGHVYLSDRRNIKKVAR